MTSAPETVPLATVPPPTAGPTGRRARSPDLPAIVALTFGLAGVGYRIVLTLLYVPATDSDEATVGLAALHIAQLRGLPVYFYGQHYMGALESYLAAPVFALLGAGTVTLRIPTLLLYAVFLALMYRLTRWLYSPWMAVFTTGLLALGSDAVLKNQLMARGGYPEVTPAAAALLLLAVTLARRRERPDRWRWSFMAFGVVTGLSVWDDWLVLPYVGAACAVLVTGCWRALCGLAYPAVVGGFVLGAVPLIVGNLTAPIGSDALSVFLRLGDAGAGATALADRLHGGVLVGIPLSGGLCPPDTCTAWQMWWGALYLPLLAVAALLAMRGLYRGRPDRSRPDPSRSERSRPTPVRPDRSLVNRSLTPAGSPSADDHVRHIAQLAVVVAAGVSVCAYVRSAAAATSPIQSARYLSILEVSLPGALWPAWVAARRWGRGAAASVPLVAVALLAAVTTAMMTATAALVAKAGTDGQRERRERALVDAAMRQGIRYAYAPYWTCNELTFLTRERLICAVVDERLEPGQDRYLPYRYRVRDAARPAFIFPADDPADRTFRAYLRDARIHAVMTEVGGYRIYLPAVTVKPHA